MIIDAHTHIGPWQDYFFGLNGDLKDLVGIMDKTKIGKAVVFKSDGLSNQELIKIIDDDDRFFFFWWASENDGFLDYQDRIRGLKIHPTIEGRRVDYFKKHLGYAVDRHLPVIIHCGRYHPVASYKYALDVARDYKTEFILAHMGGANPGIAIEAIEAAKALNNVFFGIEGIVEPWLLKKGIEILGPNRFIFGSDFPISHPKIYLDIVDLACNKHEKDLILGQNISRILREDES